MILLVVVSMAFSASAALQISIGEDKDPQDLQYTLGPSGNLSLGIWTDAEIAADGGLETYYILVCDITKGSIDASGATIYNEDSSIDNDAIGAGYVIMTDPPLPGVPGVSYNGAWGGVFTLGDPIPADTVIFDLIDFHCNSAVDGTIYLVGLSYDWELTTVYDSVVIHQPEPMTVALLGLGGLLLRRRK